MAHTPCNNSSSSSSSSNDVVCYIDLTTPDVALDHEGGDKHIEPPTTAADLNPPDNEEDYKHIEPPAAENGSYTPTLNLSMNETPYLDSIDINPITSTHTQTRSSVVGVHDEGYRTMKARRTSFGSWPPSMLLPCESLARAGFFYTGKSDICVCFACGVEIHRWSHIADPLMEHLKHSPTCPYIEMYLCSV